MAEEDLTLEGDEQDTPLDKKYGDIIQKQRTQAPLRSSFSLGQDIPPAKAGDVIKLSKKVGLDRDTVHQDLDNIKKTAAQPTDKEFRTILEQSPKVSKWLEDPYNAAATQNDRAHLQKLEESLSHDDPLARVQPDEEVVRRAEVAAMQRYEELIAEEGQQVFREEGVFKNITRTPQEREKLKLRLISEEIGKRREQERFIASKDKLTAGDMIGGDDPLKGIPFLGPIPRLIKAEEKALRESRMSPADMDELIQEKRLEAATARRGSTFGAKVLNTGAALTEFIGEMALTGSGGLVGNIGKGIMGRALTKGVEIIAQTLLTQMPKIAADTITRGTPETSVDLDDKGEMQIQLVGEKGQRVAVPFAQAVASSLIDVGTAHIPFHPAFKFWATKAANPTVEGFMKQYAKGGVESIIGGIAISDATKLAKELVGLAGPVEMPTSIRAMMGDKDALQELGASALVFGAAGVGGAAVQRRRAQAELAHSQALSNQNWFKETSDTVKEMESQTSHPEVVADAVKQMVVDTPREFTKVPADVFFDHYTKLGIDADKFAEELTGRPTALQDARNHGGMIQIPTDQYLTKIGATDAGPVFEKAGATFDPNIPTPDEAKRHIAELEKLQEDGKKPAPTPDEARFQEQVKALGQSLQERAKGQGVDLAKYVEQGDAGNAKKVAGRLTAAGESVQAAKDDLGQSKPLLSEVKNLVMDPKEAEAYAKLIKDSQAAAHSIIDADALGELNKERKKQYDFVESQVRDGLKKEVERLPEYQVRSIMETGLDADGKVVIEGGIKLDREAIVDTYGEKTLESISKKLVARPQKRDVAADDVVFHGTPFDFPISEMRSLNGDLGRGFYFTANREWADTFASGENKTGSPSAIEWLRRNAKPRTIAAKLNIKNPFIGDATPVDPKMIEFLERDGFDARDINTKKELLDWFSENATAFDSDTKEAATTLFKHFGYDGVIKLGKRSEYVAFERGQIKEVQATATEGPRIGVAPDAAAELLGLSSGDELIQKLSAMEPMESVIDRRTAEIMAKMRLNELMELPEKAKDAIHNDQEAKVKAYQIKWLLQNRLPQMKDVLKRASNLKAYVQEFRDHAEAKVAADSDRLNSPAIYEAAERKANKDAREALLGGDLEGAIPLMELEILNHELYRASVKARNDARRIREYAAEFDKSDKRKLLYAAGERYLAQADALRERFSFKRQSESKLEAMESLKEFAENEANEGYISQIPEKLLKESYKQNWRDVPIDDLRAIERTLTQLENNAKLKTTIVDGNQKKSVDALALDMANQIRSSKKKLDTPIDSFDASEEGKRSRRDLLLSPRNDAAILREMDGFKDGGVMQQAISRRLNEAGTKEAQLNERATMALDKIYGRFSATEQLKMKRKQYIPEIKGSLDAYQRMEIAAILGQKGARQRFMDGRGWGDVELKAITERLTKAQWEWVSDVHKLLKSYEAEVKEQIERRTGLPAKMVEAEPIETPYGTQDGGYFPFKYDPRFDPKTGKQLDIDEAKRSMHAAGIQAQTKHGFAEQRVESVKGKRLRFDAGVLFEHLREVNHDIAWSEPLRDLSRLLNHKDVAKAITEHYGDQTHRQLLTSLHDIAVGDKAAANAFERGANWLRQGSTTAALGWSFMQAATDMTGLAQGASRIGAKYMAAGARKVLGDAVHMENAFKEMMDNSEMMRLRSKTSMRELNEVRNQVQKKGTAAMIADMGLEKLTGGRLEVSDIHDSYYYMMNKIQIAQEGPLWWGAMERAKAEHPLASSATPEAKAELKKKWVSIADQAVLDAYGGGQIKDLAPIQKGGPIQKLLFSTFYTFANRTLNMAIEKNMQFWRGPKSAGTVGRYVADMALLYTLPALVTFAIKNALTGNDKDLEKRFLADQFAYALGSVPLVREAAPGLTGRDYSGPAGLRFFSALGGLGKSAWEGKMDWKDLNTASGILFHYPALQLQRTLEGLSEWLDKSNGTPLSPFFGPPKVRK